MSSHGGTAVGWSALAMGAVLLLAVAGLGSFYGFDARFGGPREARVFALAYVSDGEWRLWLASLLLLAPGCVAIALGLRRPLWRGAGALARRAGGITTGRERLLAVGCALALVALYRGGRALLLRDHMVTDDETMIRFGGRILASGRLSVERPWPEGTFTELYTATVDGRMFSMDWPGGLVFAALAEASGLGALLYAAAAAAAALAVWEAARCTAGRRAAWLAGLLWLVSPMVWTLSLTRHTHLVSRTCIALALLAGARLWGRRAGPGGGAGLGWAALLGASAGAALATRPAEALALLAPAGAFLAGRALHDGTSRRQLAAACLGLLPFVAGHLLYNQALTGDPLVWPRALAEARDVELAALGLWQRFGANLSFNLLMLAIWLLGAAGLPLALAGGVEPGVLPKLWLAGVGAHLLLALAHENVGIHMVGPIHYSESAVPLVLLASVALVGLHDRWRDRVPPDLPPALLVGGVLGVVGLGALYAPSLAGLGRVADVAPAAARRAGVHHAIVLAPPPSVLERRIEGSHGTWQHAHPPPDPGVEDDVLFVRPGVDVARLRRAFPDRAFHRLVADGRGGFEVRPLGAGPSR